MFFFKKHKMKIKELQDENEHLKSTIHRLSTELQQADITIKKLQSDVERLFNHNKSLANELNHLTMKVVTSNANQNDSLKEILQRNNIQ